MVPSIRGQNIIHAKEYLIDRFGPGSIARIMEVLDEEDRAVIGRKTIPVAWEPEKSYISLLAKADQLYGRGDFNICLDIGYYTAQKAVPKFFKIFIRLGDPLFVIKRASIFWSQVHNHGKLEVIETGKNIAMARLSGYLTPSKVNCFGTKGYIYAVFELSGAKNIVVTEKRCVNEGASYCEIEVRWE